MQYRETDPGECVIDTERSAWVLRSRACISLRKNRGREACDNALGLSTQSIPRRRVVLMKATRHRIRSECSTPECAYKAAFEGGRCRKCWDMWQVEIGYPNGVCEVSECGRPRRPGAELCASHAIRARRNANGVRAQGDPLRPIGARQQCSVDGCDRTYQANGFCQLHRRRAISAKKKRVRKSLEPCRFPDCNRNDIQARGYCTRHYTRFHRYGITPEHFLELLDQQAGACSICRVEFAAERDIHVDHDHGCCPSESKRACGSCVRGLLCRECNWGLGSFQDDANRLLAAVRYLAADA